MFWSGKTNWLWLLGLLLGIPALVFFTFGRALIQGWAPIDDILLVTQNLAAHGLTWEHIRLAFTTYDPELYIPLTLLSFQIDYSIGGLMPQVFHLTNLILHSLNAMLVVLLLHKLTSSRWGALLAGLLFAVHPLHTEAVVWITGRKDLLFGFFTLLSLFFWTDREKGTWRTVLAILFLALALLSKVTAVIVFPLWILIDWHRGNLQTFKRANLQTSSPFLIGLLLCLTLGLVSFGGKERVLGSQPLIEMLFTGFRSIWFYATQMFVPGSLAISHEWIGTFSLFHPELLLGLALTVAMTYWSWLQRRRHPWIAFGWLFFLLAVIPTFLGSRKGGTLLFAVDRYGYIPSIGILFLGLMTARAMNIPRATAPVALVLILIAASVSTVQTRTWDSPEALFEHSLKVTPDSIGSRVSLAEVMLQGGDIEGSFAVLKEGLKYGEDRLLSLAAANAYAKAGDTAGAREQFSKILLSNPKDPDALFGNASLDEQAGLTDAALTGYQKAVDADPSFVAARNGIARISLSTGDKATAVTQLNEALRWNPSAPESHRLMAGILENDKNFAGAEDHLEKLLSVDGESAETLLSLARVLMAQRKTEEARVHIERVLDVEPRNREAQEMIVNLE